jgi:hypothetical protein
MQMSDDSKTIGQIEWEARMEHYRKAGFSFTFPEEWRLLVKDQKDAMEAGANAVWDQAVEACVSIVAEGVKWEPEEFYSDTHIKASNETAYLLAKALRSLKRSQSQTEEDK